MTNVANQSKNENGDRVDGHDREKFIALCACLIETLESAETPKQLLADLRFWSQQAHLAGIIFGSKASEFPFKFSPIRLEHEPSKTPGRVRVCFKLHRLLGHVTSLTLCEAAYDKKRGRFYDSSSRPDFPELRAYVVAVIKEWITFVKNLDSTKPPIGDASSNGSPLKNRESNASPEFALIDGEEMEILAIAKSNKTVDQKMREICGINRTCIFWESPRWAQLIGADESTIRGCRFWRVDRKAAIAAAKSLD